jgi:hypothetical protein
VDRERVVGLKETFEKGERFVGTYRWRTETKKLTTES